MEDLQALWNKAARNEQTNLDRESVERIISRKSNDELEKFRKTVKLEYILTLVLFPFVAIGGLWFMPDKAAYFVINLFVLGCLFFYQRVMQKFRQIHVEDDLRTYLRHALQFVKSFVRQYIAICWAGGFLGLYVGYIQGNNSGSEFAQSQTEAKNSTTDWFAQNEWLVYAGLVFLLVGSIAGIHFYIKHLYSARINNLQKLLEELNDA